MTADSKSTGPGLSAGEGASLPGPMKAQVTHVMVPVTEGALVSMAAAEVEGQDIDKKGIRLSTQERAAKQKKKMQRAMVKDVVDSTQALQPYCPAFNDVPDVWNELKDAQRKNLNRHFAELGVEQDECVRLVESLMEQVGYMRTRNKKLLSLSNRMNNRAAAASKNCLFKLVTCRVQVQPAPTKGWSWVCGTLGDDEYHAFRRLDGDSDRFENYKALTVSYEQGHCGERQHVFSVVALSRATAPRARYDLLMWNSRVKLLDALIEKVATLEPSKYAHCSAALFGGLEGSKLATGGDPKDVSVSAFLRKDRDEMYDRMLMLSEEVCRLEDLGKDYSKPNHDLCACLQELPDMTQKVNTVLKAMKEAVKNGNSLRIELGDGKYSVFDPSAEEQTGAKTTSTM